MPRGVALNLLASALTFLAILALLGSASVVGDAAVLAPVTGQHDEVIRDFYDAVNDALRSGNMATLDRVVGQTLVFSAPTSQITSNREGFERYLTSIHTNFRDFQLQVQDIVSDGDRAVAHVVGGSHEPGSFLGLTFAVAPMVFGWTSSRTRHPSPSSGFPRQVGNAERGDHSSTLVCCTWTRER
jgi:predicted ester cyclase